VIAYARRVGKPRPLWINLWIAARMESLPRPLPVQGGDKWNSPLAAKGLVQANPVGTKKEHSPLILHPRES